MFIHPTETVILEYRVHLPSLLECPSYTDWNYVGIEYVTVNNTINSFNDWGMYYDSSWKSKSTRYYDIVAYCYCENWLGRYNFTLSASDNIPWGSGFGSVVYAGVAQISGPTVDGSGSECIFPTPSQPPKYSFNTPQFYQTFLVYDAWGDLHGDFDAHEEWNIFIEYCDCDAPGPPEGGHYYNISSTFTDLHIWGNRQCCNICVCPVDMSNSWWGYSPYADQWKRLVFQRFRETCFDFEVQNMELNN